jgi:glycosyltransferase involved in cell wall biosynthesis
MVIAKNSLGANPCINPEISLDKYPSVTVIMPVYNEERYIERSLRCVLAQDYPCEKIEIIVADGMSTDGTRQVVQRLQEECQRIRLIDNPGRIAPTGLNAALRQANGEVVVRVDGHCEIEPHYLETCVHHFQEDGVDGVGGAIETIGENRLSQAIAVAMSSEFGVGGSPFRILAKYPFNENHTRLVDTIPFPAYSRQIIEKAGFYDEELVRNQDDEYNYRIRELGGKLLLSADIRPRYYSRSSLRSLWRQYYQYGFWKVRVLQKHPRQMQVRQFIPPLFVLGLASLLLLAPWSKFTALGLAIYLGLYLLINLAASSWEASRRGWRYLPYLPMVNAILHLSYGLGFGIGLVHFRKRWINPSQ